MNFNQIDVFSNDVTFTLPNGQRYVKRAVDTIQSIQTAST